jgi:M6 family metalloprotease-like protein
MPLFFLIPPLIEEYRGNKMKKIRKIIVLAVFGMLFGMNLAFAMPVGESNNSVTEPALIEKTLSVGPQTPNTPAEPGNSQEPVGTPESGGPVTTASASAPPPPTGFDSPVTPKTGVVPLLTVFIEWSDAPGDTNPAFVQGQLFSAGPSLNAYMAETSYYQFQYSNQGHFTWIPAWDDPLTTDDESTRAYWGTAPDPTYHGGTFISHGLLSLDNDGFDFAPFDYNNDGNIDFGNEIAYLMIDSMDPGLAGNYRGGSTRTMPPLTLDGKSTSGSGCTVSEDSPWITLYAHELAHEVLKLPDYYGITLTAIGSFTLMGWSLRGGTPLQPVGPHNLDPYSKMKLGWFSPIVVTSDGYYDLPYAAYSDVSFILHDPSHGTDEYYMVENRIRRGYDEASNQIGPLNPPHPPAEAPSDIPDEGILIWHVDETRAWDGDTTGGFSRVYLERRAGSDSKAAFNGDDPGYYDFYDDSSPRSAQWNDGTDSMCGVWAVSEVGETMRAWLDVPGPGICVEVLTDTPSVEPGYTVSLSVRLVNTGETSDTFSLSVGGMTNGMDITVPGPVTLNSKEETIVEIDITPSRMFSTQPGIRTFLITAQSNSNPSVSTAVQGFIDVLPFGKPHVTIPINIRHVEPGMSTYYILDVYNLGNVVDDMTLSFTGIDFGTTFEAYPTAIPLSWITLNPTVVSAPPANVAKSNLTISVPSDWAGMENATYDFMITATSSITPDSHSKDGHLIVHATTESKMYYVKAELEDLESDVDALPSSDVKDGLLAKVHAAQNKLQQAFDRYQAGDDPPASNHFRTTQNMLEAFIHQTDAQRGKALTETQADDLASKAQGIIEHIGVILTEI